MWQGLPRPCLFRIVRMYEAWGHRKRGVILSEAKDPLIACNIASPGGILRFAQDDTPNFAA